MNPLKRKGTDFGKIATIAFGVLLFVIFAVSTYKIISSSQDLRSKAAYPFGIDRSKTPQQILKDYKESRGPR